MLSLLLDVWANRLKISRQQIKEHVCVLCSKQFWLICRRKSWKNFPPKTSQSVFLFFGLEAHHEPIIVSRWLCKRCLYLTALSPLHPPWELSFVEYTWKHNKSSDRQSFGFLFSYKLLVSNVLWNEKVNLHREYLDLPFGNSKWLKGNVEPLQDEKQTQTHTRTNTGTVLEYIHLKRSNFKRPLLKLTDNN